MRWTIYLTSVLLTLTLTWSSPMLMVSGQQSDGDTAVSESLTSPTISSNTEAAIVAEAKAATGDAKQPPAPTTTSLTTSLLSGTFFFLFLSFTFHFPFFFLNSVDPFH